MSKSSPTISQKIEQLDAKVDWFYSDDFTLDTAAANYRAAAALAAEIAHELQELKNEITVIDQDFTK